jgi:type IV pilus assembly protein PilX
MINRHIKHRNSSALTGRMVRTASRRWGQSPQRGMTLIVGVVLLAMLTVITVVGFRNTTLSERMTGNAFDRNTSFQSAENAGKEALQALPAIKAGTIPGSGYYSTPLVGGGDAAFWTQGAGATVSPTACATTQPFSWTSCSALVASKYTFATNANSAQNAQLAQYVIELLPSVVGSTDITYRVTTRSTGGSGNAEVVLQSIYVRP